MRRGRVLRLSVLWTVEASGVLAEFFRSSATCLLGPSADSCQSGRRNAIDRLTRPAGGVARWAGGDHHLC